MKNLKLLGYLMVFASALLCVQCTSDAIGPPGSDGANGIDGIDGIDGVDGVDGTASCVSCHSNENRDPLFASWELSKHGTGFIGFAAPREDCAQCHGEEGYVDYITTGSVREYTLELIGVDSLGFAVYDTINPYPNASPLYCTTCHDKHSTFDFENDGPDYALRNFSAVTLVIDSVTVVDFGDASNNCITCHQPRNSYEIPSSTGDYEITSKRFGPHHGPQATMLEGIMGANIAGSEPYPGVASAAHRTGASCVSCHMGESSDISQGLHSWNPKDAACITCHPAGAPDEINGFTADMATLEALLAANNMFDVDGYYVPGTYSAKLAQAAWNYRTLLEDQSKGVHNPAYTRALLKNSIEALQN